MVRPATDRAKIAFALALLILLSTHALFSGRLMDGHDPPAYPPRLTEFAKVLGEHQFPPVWAPDFSNGHGQPLFEFFPPLTYLVALPLFECGLSLADSLQFSLAMLFAMGAVAVYLLGRGASFSPIASLGGAAAWLFAPYQALDLYVRVDSAESSALAVAPIALLALTAVLRRPTMSRVALGAAAIALLPLAHNAVALLMVPIFGVIVVVRSAISERPLRTAAAGAAAIAGALGLSAFFWLPALLEKDLVKTELHRTGYFLWSNHIISPWQLLWGRWGFGYSVPGPHDGMSFSLGLVHVALAIEGVLIGVRALSRPRRVYAMLFAGIALAGALLATEWSSPVWARITTLQCFQFPWRALCVPALFMPLLAFYAFEPLAPRASFAVILLLVLVNLNHTEPKGYLIFDDAYYGPASIAQNGLETVSGGYFEPRWVESTLKYTGDGILVPTALTSVRKLSWTSTRHAYSVVSPGLVRAIDSTNYYPGWTVLIDGHETTISPAPVFGTISFEVPPGQHTITVELRPTPVRRVGLIISLATLAVLLSTLAAAYFARMESSSQISNGATAAARDASPDS